MEMIKVPSVMIEAVGHDGFTTLHVEFQGGSTYRYWPVSSEEFEELLSADSVGSHFSQNIKKVKEYERVEDEK